MFTRDERRALVFLAAVAAAGGLMRVVRAHRGGGGAGPPGAAVVAPELPAHDLSAQLARVRQAEEQVRPLRPGEKVDLDRAGPAELERLPGVGPELARRIVADRDTNGPFGSLEGLDRVRGVGPAMLARLERWAVFSGVARVTKVQASQRVARRRRAP